MTQSSLPRGELVESVGEGGLPRRTDYVGQFITLAPVDPQADADELYACTHGTVTKEQVWTYMGYGPFESVGNMRMWLSDAAESQDPLFFAVHQNNPQRRMGMVSFLNIVADMRRLEVGHIWYTPEAQGTQANTEAAYLMLCEAFDRLNYRRVEWKCDALNARSRAAALRLGFSFEGIFRQHMIVKGRNRDTAWFAMLDSEWPLIKRNFETWLYRNPDWKISLTELNRGRL
ncbi:MAG: GNAT family protein [Chloroflexi bacterium]|nr:GNAT family protein [Chloroflexota bacterium]